MKISLPLRINLISLLFAGFVTLVTSVLGGALLYRQERENAQHHALEASADLSSLAGHLAALGLRVEDFVGFEEQCENLLANAHLLHGVAVFDQFGRRLYYAGVMPERVQAERLTPLSKPQIEEFGERLFAFSAVLNRAGLPQAYVAVQINDGLVFAATLARVAWLLACVAVLFCIGLVFQQWVFWRTIGRPLAKLVGAADAIRGEQPQRLESGADARREDEIGSLWRAFGELVARLFDARQALLAQNERLEEAVQARTAELEHVNRELALDVERRRELEAELRNLASTDALTGLYNRGFMLPYLEHALERGRRPGAPRPGLMLFDFDGFKAVNDRFGHAAGDRVLQQMSLRLQQASRQGDVLARLGGDEFLLCFEAGSLEQAEGLAQRLLAQFEAPIEVAGQALQLSASLGIALHPDHGESMEALMAAADAAMYLAKSEGGGWRLARMPVASD